MSSYKIERWASNAVESRLEELATVYAEVYAEAPYNSGELWSVQAFADRTRRQAARDGFSFVAALVDDEIAGFSFGLTFPSGVWWSGDATPPSADLFAASKFAVIELVVRQRWRENGIGHRLLDSLLTDRTEQYAILTAMPDALARDLYRRWGWTQTGHAHHTPSSPVLDALVLGLPARNDIRDGLKPQ